MNDRTWDDLLDMIDVKYGIDKHAKSEEPLEENPGFKKQTTTVLFEKDGENLKVERVTTPAVQDTKSHYSHRGAAQRVQKVYDPHETVNHVMFYRKANGGWLEVDAEELFRS